MMTRLLTATALSGLMISGAFAQTTPPATPPATSTPPAATPAPATSTPSTTTTTSSSAQPKFVSAQTADQWLATKFHGTDVMGPNNEKVGDVNDILFDKSGKVLAVVIGVGGFLGIGEKNVAVEMSSLEVMPADANSNETKLKLAMTKDQLKAAPSFETYKAPARTTSAPAGGNTGTRPTAPAPAAR